MKIEKISKNKIRCTLTSEDLAERKIKMSELAYGSEKAKKLFRDMLEQAAIECDFEGDEMPIMVEAIPTSASSLVLYITKVENPDELDARFSNFTPGEKPENDEPLEEELANLFSGTPLEGLDDGAKNVIKDLVSKLKEKFGDTAEVYVDEKRAGKKEEIKLIDRVFTFDNVEALTSYAAIAGHSYKGVSNLYKDPHGAYYLVLSNKNATVQQFNNACNVACEFGRESKNANMAFFGEHYKCVIKNNAIDALAAFK